MRDNSHINDEVSRIIQQSLNSTELTAREGTRTRLQVPFELVGTPLYLKVTLKKSNQKIEE